MTIWVIVADNSRARFFTANKPAGPLTETQDLANPCLLYTSDAADE